MKKVLLYMPGIDYGGIETFLYNIVNCFLDDEDIRVSVLTRNGVVGSDIYNYLVKIGVAESLGIEHLGIVNGLSFRKKLRRYFREHEYDVLHMHESNEPYVIDEAIKMGVKKVMLHFHSVKFIEGKNEVWRVAVKKLIREKNVRRSNIILAPSLLVFESIKPLIREKEIFVVPNAIDTKKYAFDFKARELYRKKNYIAEDTIVIGHVGRFVDAKNQGFIAELFNQYKKRNPYKDVRLVFVGEGPQQDGVRMLIKDYGMEDDVVFLNNSGDVPGVLSMLDIFVFPSKFEGLGISLIEAQCSGLPCLISNRIPTDAIVTDLISVCDLDSDSEEWIQVLEGIRKNSDREKYAEIVAGSGYGINAIKEKMKEIYLGSQ